MATNTAVYSGHSGVAMFDVGGSATVMASVTAFGISNTGSLTDFFCVYIA